MTKKLLIFMLVLGLVSWANAVPIITFTSPGLPACTHGVGADFDVQPGQVITVQIKSDTACTSAYLVSIMESTTSAAGNATATGTGSFDPNFNFNLQAGNLRNAMTNSGAGTPRFILIDRISAGMNPAGNIPAGQALYWFELLIPEDAEFCDTFTVDAAVGFPIVSPPPPAYSHAQDAVNIVTTDPLVLHVVPEPATLLLLGLGGLLLRRRK